MGFTEQDLATFAFFNLWVVPNVVKAINRYLWSNESYTWNFQDYYGNALEIAAASEKLGFNNLQV